MSKDEHMYAYDVENTSLEITQRLLVRRLAVICGHGNTADAQLVDAVADALESGAWFMAGIKSPEHFVAWQTGSSSARSHHVVAVARRREELPATYGLFAHGELSLDQIAVVAAHAPSWADAEVATFAKHATVSQLRHALRKYPWPAYLHLDTDGAWLNAGPALPRSLFEHVTCDGVVQPVWEREGRAVNIGRVKQIVPDHTRRIVVDRDR